ncbi:Ig-like domain-containing protein [Bacillus sp. 1P10SD]|uniref:Ig-like domain-containing protein n=1 Tax=Bacillus sp. 1P10SD TaxID=3132265 RepID=UPI0039A41F4E
MSIPLLFGSSKVWGEGTTLPPKGYIDAPTYGATLKGQSEVTGWFLDGNGVSKIEVLVDGKSMGLADYGIARTDVQKAFPDYQNGKSGYHFSLNTKNLTNGQHSLSVRETGNNNATNNLNSIINVANSILSPKGYIESPAPGSKINGLTNIEGWFLDGSGVSKIEILVDGKIVGDAQYGTARPDVAKAFPDYQEANSGYRYSLDTRNLTNGQHSLTVRGTGKNGVLTVLGSQMVDIQNISAKGYMETPTAGSTISGLSKVQGWFLDESGVSKIEILVDGKSVGAAEYGIARPDVAKAYPLYQNANSGYQYNLDTTSLTNGQHTVTVKETGNNGTTTVLSNTVVNIQNIPSVGYLETPSVGSTIGGISKVQGWFLDKSGVSKIEILVDGKSVGAAEYGIARPDVAKAYPLYQNANSGYQYNLDTTSLTNGQHTITVKETGNNGVTRILNNHLINVQNVSARGSIDLPTGGSTISGVSNLQGWFLDLSGVSKIEILVDGKSMGVAEYGFARPDVAKAYPIYQNANSGYKYALDTRKLTNGQHSLIVRETGNNGVTTEIGIQNVKVQNLPTKGSIDTPANASSVKGNISVSGWILDVGGVSKVEVLVDGNILGEAQYGSARPDVAQIFSEYQNANSGYQFTFNSLQFTDGQHTLSIRETGANGSTYMLNNVIYIYNGNPYLQVDLRKPSNITAQEIVDFFNKKRPDSPLKDYAQSFIDAQNKYGVNAQYLVAHAIWETGWGGSNLKTYKHNLYGYSAYDSCPFTCGYYFPTGGDSINFEGYIVRRDYLNENGAYYNGPTLKGMNVRYASDPNWANGIANLMLSMKPFDAASYIQSNVLPSSPVVAPSFGRNIPAGQSYPTSVMIVMDTNATVNTNGLSFRAIPYVQAATLVKTIPSGTVVKVLGYNTDVIYVPGDTSKYPYDNRWYRVLVDGQEGWVYGGGITFN